MNLIELNNLLDAGLSIIPIASKKKTPHSILGKTHSLLTRKATKDEAYNWIEANINSFAVAGGEVSGNLVTLDFDEKHQAGLYDSWYNKLSDEARKILDTCQINSTRNKGTHVRYRTSTPKPTVKLARRLEWNEDLNHNQIVTTAETKCSGGYALIPPTEGYKNIQGSLLKLPLVSDEIHEEFLDVLRIFNEIKDEPEPLYEWKPTNTYSTERPGDRFNAQATWEEILEPHGWKKDSKNYWVRPGKDVEGGISATTDHDGIPMFYVFSTSAHPFEANKGYTKFTVYTLLNHKGNFSESAKEVAKKYPREEDNIDISKFKEMSIGDVCKVLDSTIKKDDANKAVTFLAMLTAHTEESQINIFYNAPSSVGKSHLALSTSDLFPKPDLIILSHCSPTAFFHEQGIYDKEKNEIIVDLSRKILIFTDMPNSGLLEKLRSILSHDQKRSVFKITDKNQKGGNRTKTVVIIGYPSVFFCSAGLRVDEQESTRFIMLSPSVEQDKILQGIQQTITKESDREKFMETVNSDPERILLKERILAIKHEHIDDVKIENTALVEKLFLQDTANLQPRQQRDIKKIMSLIKGFTLLNLWFREQEGSCVYASDKDIEDGFNLWSQISFGQDYGLSPYVMSIYTKIILPLWDESGRFDKSDKQPVTRKQLLDKHFRVFHKPLGVQYLRQQILPQLESVGLIMQERGTSDSREMVIIPLETSFEVELPEVKVTI
jgi:hypothetical protein